MQTSGNWLLAQHQACTQQRGQLALSALVSGPTASLPAVHRVNTAALACNKRSAREAARKKSSVAKAWKPILPAMRQNRRLPVHDVAWLLVGVHQYLLLSCRQVHISLVMSVLMLTIDSCSSSLAVAATQTRVPTVRYICMHDRTLFIAYNEQCVNKIEHMSRKRPVSCMSRWWVKYASNQQLSMIRDHMTVEALLCDDADVHLAESKHVRGCVDAKSWTLPGRAS